MNTGNLKLFIFDLWPLPQLWLTQLMYYLSLRLSLNLLRNSLESYIFQWRYFFNFRLCMDLFCIVRSCQPRLSVLVNPGCIHTFPQIFKALIFMIVFVSCFVSVQVLLHRDPWLSYPVSDHARLRIWLWHVLCRFYRVSYAKNRNKPSFSLGL